ncbi:ciliogenesis-associated TTC17-interacting protein [Brachyhypopomus gauderio]|uniref:ciliogenesis-associated TTC17-interacting protein n=1 Tax=Brachyhypopomus gauderio TaxID=698409 RepID=UPI004041A839
MTDAEELHVETGALKASEEAIEFISNIGPRDVDRCLFVDSLVITSDTERELGEFCVNVQTGSYNEAPCYVVQANSHGTVDGVPCGTSISAYLSLMLEPLEENHHEYMKLQQHTLDKKVHIVKQDGHLVVNRVITEKEEVTKHTFTVPLNSLRGFVSEASNFVLMRILAQLKKVPENMLFLSLDADTQITVSTYRELGSKRQIVSRESLDVFGIERTISPTRDNPASWHCYFLSNGHLASRVQVGSPVRMCLLHLPVRVGEEEKPVFEKKPLVWEEDMELYSKFLDRKEELRADHCSYVRQHPELKTLLADFLQLLLLRKPHDVCTFARDFFAPFASLNPPGSIFKASRTMADSDGQGHDKPNLCPAHLANE